jgi:antitoxin component of RelBE/YafQ-DinJ toxin-antitoxin module
MNKKDSQLLIKINADTKKEFINICEDLNSNASREIRLFIKDFIKNNTKE